MESSQDKKAKIFGKNFYKVTLSVILLLLVIITMTSKTIIGSFFTYIFAFCFGYFYPIVLLFFAILSLKIIITKSGFHIKKYLSFKLGLVVIFISSLCFASFFLIAKDPNFDFSKLSYTYTDLMKSFARSMKEIDSFSSLSSLGGGYIGAFFVALFGSIWHAIGDAIFFSILMLFGISLLVYKPISYLVNQYKENKAKKVVYKSDYQDDNQQAISKKLTNLSSWNKNDDEEENKYLENSFAPQGDLKATSTFKQITINDDNEKNEQIENTPNETNPYNDDDYSDQGGLKSSTIFASKSSNDNSNSENNDSSSVNEIYSYLDDKYDDDENKQIDDKPATSLNFDDEFKSLREDENKINNSKIDYAKNISSLSYDDTALQEDDDDFVVNNVSNYENDSVEDNSYNNSVNEKIESSNDYNSSDNSSFNDYKINTDDDFNPSFNPLEEQAKRASKTMANTSITLNMAKKEDDEDEENVLSEEEQNQMKIDAYFKKKREEEEKARLEKEEQNKAQLAELYKFVSTVDRIYTYPLPDDTLLDDIDDSSKIEENKKAAEEKGQIINQVFEDFNIKAKVQSSTIGSSVTRFNIALDKGVKSEKLTSIVTELQRALRGDKSVRIETVVEGQDMPGIEIGNAKSMAVSFKEVFTTIEQNTKENLLIPIGKDISGNIVTYPLNKMPHLLVAGTTGSGKSVLVHSIIMTLLMRNYPSRLKLMLIDPKQVEFNKYAMEPHLFCPIISDAEQAVIGLSKLCDEMERRYSILKQYGLVNMDEYRAKKIETRNPDMGDLPDIVCIIDEFADLMQTSNGAVTDSIQRITQKARAAGIYLIVATQRPEKNVIPGVIKSNIPCRIGLSCSSSIDSRVILDETGAETLLGKGDLLFKCTTNRNLVRAQSPFISNNDISRVLDYLKLKAGVPNYSPDFLDLKPQIEEDSSSSYANPTEELYDKIKDFVISTHICSKSTLMKNFAISYNKVDMILNRLKQDGIIESVQGNKYRVCEEYE